MPNRRDRLLAALLAALVSTAAACARRPAPSEPGPPAPAGPSAPTEGAPAPGAPAPAPDAGGGSPSPPPSVEPEAPVPEPDPGAADAEMRSRILDFVAERLSVEREQCTLRQLERTIWSDSSLGCPQPGQVYLTVETPGYRAEVQTPAGVKSVHTDLEAGRLVLCEQED